MRTDRDLIDRFIALCAERGETQTQMARMVRRSRGWASLLVNGRIKRLHFATRNRIAKVLEKENA